MHEVGLMQTALEMAFAHARQAGASRIHRMRLRIGALSGVVPEALEMAFVAATLDTPADGAELILEQVPVICRCAQCDYEFCPDDVVFLCFNCGALNTAVQNGRELVLASLEVS
jgi:hydrogenase nickel incorporation protein HypA/HybF